MTNNKSEWMEKSLWMDKMFRKFDEQNRRRKILRPNFGEWHVTTPEDNRLIHGIKKIDDGEGK
jgi:hypothetical protein